MQGAFEESGIALSVGMSTSTNSCRSMIEFRQWTAKFTVKCRTITIPPSRLRHHHCMDDGEAALALHVRGQRTIEQTLLLRSVI